MPTEQICVQFNDLRQVVETEMCLLNCLSFFLSRNDILLLLDLKSACDACEFELQSLKHRYEGLSPTQQSSIVLPDLVPHTPKRVSLVQFSCLQLVSHLSILPSLNLPSSLLFHLPLSLSPFLNLSSSLHLSLPLSIFLLPSLSHWPLVFR